MASKSRLALAAALLASTANAQEALWTITSYLVPVETVEVYTDTFYPDGSTSMTYTDYKYLKPTITPTYTAALSTSTDYYAGADIETVYVYLNSADVAPEDIATGYNDYDYDSNPYSSTIYVQPIEFPAPSSCPTPFTATYLTTLYIPVQVTDQLPEMSIETSITTDYNGDVYTIATAHLPSDAVPLTDMDYLNTYYSSYVSDCTDPFTSYSDSYPTGSSSSSGYSDNSDFDSSFWSRCNATSRCRGLLTYAIILLALIPFLFLLGFLESYFWFRRMMMGKSALRFGTICWIFLILPVLCFTRHVPSRDKPTQEDLSKKWKEVPFGKALGLWLRNGFRHRYPVKLLGAHPNYHNPAPVMVVQQYPPPPMAGAPVVGGGPGVIAGAPPVAVAGNGGYMYYVPAGAPPVSGVAAPSTAVPTPPQPVYHHAPGVPQLPVPAAVRPLSPVSPQQVTPEVTPAVVATPSPPPASPSAHVVPHPTGSVVEAPGSEIAETQPHAK